MEGFTRPALWHRCEGQTPPSADAPPAREKNGVLYSIDKVRARARGRPDELVRFSSRPSSGRLYYSRQLERCQHKNAIFQKFFFARSRSKNRRRAAAAAEAESGWGFAPPPPPPSRDCFSYAGDISRSAGTVRPTRTPAWYILLTKSKFQPKINFGTQNLKFPTHLWYNISMGQEQVSDPNGGELLNKWQM